MVTSCLCGRGTRRLKGHDLSFHCLPLGLPFLIPGSVWMTQAQAVLQFLSITAQLSLPKFSYLEFALMGKSVQNYQGSQRDVRPISLKLRFISV